DDAVDERQFSSTLTRLIGDAIRGELAVVAEGADHKRQVVGIERIRRVHEVKVQMRLGRVATVATASDLLTSFHPITFSNGDGARLQMGIEGIDAFGELMNDAVAAELIQGDAWRDDLRRRVGRFVYGGHDRAIPDREHRLIPREVTFVRA